MEHQIPPEIESIFDRGELVAAIAQECESSEVLMLAWMNRESLQLTLDTSLVTYWSRSRNELWVKGATSGHTQKLCAISYDCDGDAILMKVEQSGAACHTGSRTCFSREITL
jgi:phosphoribosyl-AMP cyclohydrolase